MNDSNVTDHLPDHRNSEINGLYKFSWILSTCFFDIALWISIVYWLALHPFVIEFGLLKTRLAVGFNFFVHGVNSISCIIDIFLNRRPWKFAHFYFPMMYGITYMFFSVFYWVGGGLGGCQDVPSNTTVKEGESFVIIHEGEDTLRCSKFIYPILNWDGAPGIAVATVAIGIVCLPIIHGLWMGLAHLRLKLWSCTVGSNSQRNSSQVGIEISRWPKV